MKDSLKRHRNILELPHYKMLASIVFTTVLSWVAWLLVIFKLDPWSATDLALSLFYSSSFFALTGSFTIVLFMLKKIKAKNHVHLKHVTISLRQGFLLSTCTLICIALLMLSLLRVWNGLLLVSLMMLIEFYLSLKDELK
jgi:hypothetical protein